VNTVYTTTTTLHPFNGLFSRTTWVSRHQKGNHSGFYWSERWWGGSGISWTICKSSAPCSKQITTPVSRHSVFYRLDALPAAPKQCQSTGGKTLSIYVLHIYTHIASSTLSITYNDDFIRLSFLFQTLSRPQANSVFYPQQDGNWVPPKGSEALWWK